MKKRVLLSAIVVASMMISGCSEVTDKINQYNDAPSLSNDKYLSDNDAIEKLVLDHNEYSLSKLSEDTMNDPVVQSFIKFNNNAVKNHIPLADSAKDLSKEEQDKLMNTAEVIGLGEYYNLNDFTVDNLNVIAYYIFVKNFADQNDIDMEVQKDKIIVDGDNATLPVDALKVIVHQPDGSTEVVPKENSTETKFTHINDTWYLASGDVIKLADSANSIPLMSQEEFMQSMLPDDAEVAPLDAPQQNVSQQEDVSQDVPQQDVQ